MKLAPAAYLLGVDVSHHNGTVDWPKLKAAGVVFAYCKASEGTRLTDAFFRQNVKQARDQGILVGAYHFFRSNLAGTAQAGHFLDQGVKLDLPPALDWETHDILDKNLAASRAKEWLDNVAWATGRRPVVYTSPSFIDETGNPDWVVRYPLWLAHYETEQPRVPQPWRTWVLWQFTEQRKFPGLPGHFDLNYFAGSLAALKSL